MSERLTEIEIKLAHVEQALHEMSDVIYAQQSAIDRLELAYEHLRQRVANSEAGAAAGDEKPPHY